MTGCTCVHVVTSRRACAHFFQSPIPTSISVPLSKIGLHFHSHIKVSMKKKSQSWDYSSVLCSFWKPSHEDYTSPVFPMRGHTFILAFSWWNTALWRSVIRPYISTDSTWRWKCLEITKLSIQVGIHYCVSVPPRYIQSKLESNET